MIADSLASFNLTKRYVANLLYSFPQTHYTGALGQVANGWALGTIVTAQTGFPFNPVITTNQSQSGINGGAPGNAGGFDRPNFAAGFAGPLYLNTPAQYYNPAAFALPTLGHLGNIPRNFMVGPGLTNVDFSIRKDTKVPFLGEAGVVQFRADMFNIFNHPNFGMPSNQIFSSNSPTPLTNAGKITTTATASRQMQFSLRVAF